MYTIIVILIVLASVLMCTIVVIQESKGGGLAADYASGNSLLGAPKTTNIIEKITWSLAGVMVVLSVISTVFLTSADTVDSVLQMEQPATELPSLPAVDAAPTDDAAPATDAAN